MRKRFTSALLCATLFTVSCKRDLKSHPLAPGEREEIAHQIADRDLSLDPATLATSISLPSRITDDTNAIMEEIEVHRATPANKPEGGWLADHLDGESSHHPRRWQNTAMDERPMIGIFTGLTKIDWQRKGSQRRADRNSS